MNVSEVSRLAGIAPTAVRFYERRGVLPTAARRGNSYREYTDDDLCRLRLVVSLRSLGLDVATAGSLARRPRPVRSLPGTRALVKERAIPRGHYVSGRTPSPVASTFPRSGRLQP